MVSNGYHREFDHVYGTVSPVEGEFDCMVCRKMDTEHDDRIPRRAEGCSPR